MFTWFVILQAPKETFQWWKLRNRKPRLKKMDVGFGSTRQYQSIGIPRAADMETIQIGEECDDEARLVEKGKQLDSRSMDQSNLRTPRTPIAIVHRPCQTSMMNK
jgi:hypothetical protein